MAKVIREIAIGDYWELRANQFLCMLDECEACVVETDDPLEAAKAVAAYFDNSFKDAECARVIVQDRNGREAEYIVGRTVSHYAYPADGRHTGLLNIRRLLNDGRRLAVDADSELSATAHGRPIQKDEQLRISSGLREWCKRVDDTKTGEA